MNFFRRILDLLAELKKKPDDPPGNPGLERNRHFDAVIDYEEALKLHRKTEADRVKAAEQLEKEARASREAQQAINAQNAASQQIHDTFHEASISAGTRSSPSSRPAHVPSTLEEFLKTVRAEVERENALRPGNGQQRSRGRELGR